MSNRKGVSVDLSTLSPKILKKINEIEQKTGGDVNEIRRYSNNSLGGYFGKNNLFRFVGHDNKTDVQNKIKHFYQKKIDNQQAGSNLKNNNKKKVSLKSAVKLLREYYTEQYGKN